MKKPKEGLDDFDMLVLEVIALRGGGLQWELAPVLAEWVRLPDHSVPHDWEERIAAEIHERGLLPQAA